MQTTHPVILTLLSIIAQLLYPAVSAGPPPSKFLSQQNPSTYQPSTSSPQKVPGESPAYYCSDPQNDLFQIRRLDFTPTNPRIGFYLTIRLIGNFTTSTGDVPRLNITGSINGRPERSPLYFSPLCDIDVFQKISVPYPGGDDDDVDEDAGADTELPRIHRACPAAIQEGYAVVSSPPMPLTPLTVPEGKFEVRAEAVTQEGERIFCVEGSFDVTR